MKPKMNIYTTMELLVPNISIFRSLLKKKQAEQNVVDFGIGQIKQILHKHPGVYPGFFVGGGALEKLLIT